MVNLGTVSGWSVSQGEDGHFYVRLEAVAASLARGEPSVAATLLRWLLAQTDDESVCSH